MTQGFSAVRRSGMPVIMQHPPRTLLNLTADIIRSLPPPNDRRQQEYFDVAVPGFGICVAMWGSCHWFLYYRDPDRLQHHVFLGRWPEVSTTKARNLARAILRQIPQHRYSFAYRKLLRNRSARSPSANARERRNHSTLLWLIRRHQHARMIVAGTRETWATSLLLLHLIQTCPFTKGLKVSPLYTLIHDTLRQKTLRREGLNEGCQG